MLRASRKLAGAKVGIIIFYSCLFNTIVYAPDVTSFVEPAVLAAVVGIMMVRSNTDSRHHKDSLIAAKTGLFVSVKEGQHLIQPFNLVQ